MNTTTEIPLSKNKLTLQIIGSLAFVIAGIWLFTQANSFQDMPIKFLANPIVIKTVGIISILFFGATGIYGLQKIFDKRVGLIIDENGITDNTNATSIGLIEWADITEIKTYQVMSTKSLLIKVNNAEKYIGRSKNRIQTNLMKTNMKMVGTPLSITAATLKYKFEDLEQIVQSEFQKYKSKNESY